MTDIRSLSGAFTIVPAALRVALRGALKQTCPDALRVRCTMTWGVKFHKLLRGVI
jgi:hypothetical protein